MGTAPGYSVEVAVTNPELLKDGETKKGAESLEGQGGESHAKKDSAETSLQPPWILVWEMPAAMATSNQVMLVRLCEALGDSQQLGRRDGSFVWGQMCSHEGM